MLSPTMRSAAMVILLFSPTGPDARASTTRVPRASQIRPAVRPRSRCGCTASPGLSIRNLANIGRVLGRVKSAKSGQIVVKRTVSNNEDAAVGTTAQPLCPAPCILASMTRTSNGSSSTRLVEEPSRGLQVGSLKPRLTNQIASSRSVARRDFFRCARSARGNVNTRADGQLSDTATRSRCSAVYRSGGLDRKR